MQGTSLSSTIADSEFCAKGDRVLSVYFGDMPEAIFNTSVYFKNTYLDEWLLDPLDQRMIKAVDKATVLGPNAVQSRVLGVIPPTELSGGVKTLMLVHHVPSMVFNVSTCGDNCARWLLRLASKEDRTVNLRHIMDFGDKPFTIRVMNDDAIAHDMGELVKAAIKYL